MAPALGRSSLLPIVAGREHEPAIFSRDGAALWTRAAFRERAMAWASTLEAETPGLVFLFCVNSPACLAALYGAIFAGHAVALLDPATSAMTIDRLTDAFDPDFVVAESPRAQAGWASCDVEGLVLAARPGENRGATVHAPNAVLLSTSGTTGTQKFVRLSAENLAANADQIAMALGMSALDIGIAHLPIHYSYGLSVVTSHLRIGGGVHLWDDSVTVPEFWAAVGASGATQFPGVPFHYNFLARGDLSKLVPPAVRIFTQAGGALAPRLQARMHQSASAIGARFHVMYGQTEAAPRMTTMPHDRLVEKLGAVGPALNGATLTVVDESGETAPVGVIGSVIYHGPNVMQGYAESRADLALGDVMNGRLETGDLGWLDADGYLTLTGRSKRFAKLHGLRINLEDVETRFGQAAEVAALERGDKILLFTTEPDPVAALVPTVAEEYKILTANFSVRATSEIPRKASGKTDYRALESMP